MNKVILMGRLTRDPKSDIRRVKKQPQLQDIQLAVDRSYRRDGENNADFIGCVALRPYGGVC